MERFIQPYQFNLIRRELTKVLNAVYFVGDYRSFAAIKETTGETIRSLFASNPQVDMGLFQDIELVNGQKELNEWMDRLKPYVIPFPAITDADLRKLFRKVKRLPIPDMSQSHREQMTYLGWRDISTNTLFLVYPLDGRPVGLACRYSMGQAQKGNVCCLCGGTLAGTEVGLVVTNTSADFYQSIGNYMCLDSDACNQRITNVESLESFVAQAVNGR
jgi:hypothetical protein